MYDHFELVNILKTHGSALNLILNCFFLYVFSLRYLIIQLYFPSVYVILYEALSLWPYEHNKLSYVAVIERFFWYIYSNTC